jgi:vanillate O-demethylase ferredoxin subunit
MIFGRAKSKRIVRIASKQAEALDIVSFELRDPKGRALPAFAAGAHIDVHVPGGPVRQYSLCNAPDERHRYVIAVLRDPASRGGSAGIHALQPGETIEISDPRNHFPLDRCAKHHLLLAGGIGITPILSMAESLSEAKSSFELHYCTRSAERTAFAQRIRQGPLASRCVFHHDDGDASQKLDIARLLRGSDAGTHLYVCGPTGFMNWILDAARDCGWPQARLHREYFAASGIGKSHDGSFELEIASSGAVITVRPDQSAVAALAEKGIVIPTSCEQGVCGTCLVRVVQGTPEHRDLCLTPDQKARGDRFTPCCSRSLTPRLVVDL